MKLRILCTFAIGIIGISASVSAEVVTLPDGTKWNAVKLEDGTLKLVSKIQTHSVVELPDGSRLTVPSETVEARVNAAPVPASIPTDPVDDQVRSYSSYSVGYGINADAPSGADRTALSFWILVKPISGLTWRLMGWDIDTIKSTARIGDSSIKTNAAVTNFFWGPTYSVTDEFEAGGGLNLLSSYTSSSNLAGSQAQDEMKWVDGGWFLSGNYRVSDHFSVGTHIKFPPHGGDSVAYIGLGYVGE